MYAKSDLQCYFQSTLLLDISTLGRILPNWVQFALKLPTNGDFLCDKSHIHLHRDFLFTFKLIANGSFKQNTQWKFNILQQL